jgi:hypothetical protein
VGRKRLKRELRALAERHDRLERAHRRLAAHTEVIGVALRAPDRVSQTDLDDAIDGVHDLNSLLESRSFPRVDPRAGQEHFGPSH